MPPILLALLALSVSPAAAILAPAVPLQSPQQPPLVPKSSAPETPAPRTGSGGLPEGVRLLEVTKELLERWDVALERYRALPPEDKAQLQRDLSVGEDVRNREVAVLRELGGAQWKRLVTAKGFPNAEGRRLLDERKRALRASGVAVPKGVELARTDGKALSADDYARAEVLLARMFDGAASRPGDAKAGDELVWDARFQNGTLHHLNVTNTRTGTTWEVGQLGVDGRHVLLGPSPYVNATKRWESEPGSWVDYRARAQIALVQLNARYFEEAPGDARLDRAFELGRRLGLSDEKSRTWSSYFRYEDPYRAQNIVVASVLAEVGRAYNLFGPVDVAWSLTNLTKLAWFAPNTAFDESAGVRVKLGETGSYLGVFGGVTQNLSPVGNRIMQGFLSADKVDAGLFVEQAPHATVALWGKVPGVSDLDYALEASHRRNADTRVYEGRAALITTLADRPLTLSGSYSRERGDGIEFDRERLRAELQYELGRGVNAFVGVERERFRFGSAEVESDAAMAGITIFPGAGRSKVTVDGLFGGRYLPASGGDPTALSAALGLVQTGLTKGLAAAEEAEQAWQRLRGEIDPAQWQLIADRLSRSLVDLGPQVLPRVLDELAKAGLNDAQRRLISDLVLRTLSPSSPYYQQAQGWLQDALARGPEALGRIDDAAAWFDAHKEDIRGLISLLGDERMWEAAMVQAGRKALVENLAQENKIEIPQIGLKYKFKVTPGVLLAAGSILNSRLSPMAPIGKGELEPWLLKAAGRELGLSGEVTEADLIGGLWGMADRQLQAALQERLAGLDGLLASVDAADRQRAVDQVLGALPPELRGALQSRYGTNLESLLPAAGTDPAAIRAALARLPAELSAFLHQEIGPDLEKGVAQLVGWAAELLRRQIDQALLHILLAAEELDRLTVDGGLKAGDLGVKMLQSSFQKLDARKQRKALDRLDRAARNFAEDRAAEDAALGKRFVAYGKERLESAHLAPDWPQGLTIEVPEEAWLPILGGYGDGAFFALVERLKTRYAALGKKTPLAVSFEFEADGHGTQIRPKGQTLAYRLRRPRDGREGEFILSGLEEYLD